MTNSRNDAIRYDTNGGTQGESGTGTTRLNVSPERDVIRLCEQCSNSNCSSLTKFKWNPPGTYENDYFSHELADGSVQSIRARSTRCQFCNFLITLWNMFKTTCNVENLPESDVICHIWKAQYPQFYPLTTRISCFASSHADGPSFCSLVKFRDLRIPDPLTVQHRKAGRQYLDPCQFIYLSEPRPAPSKNPFYRYRGFSPRVRSPQEVASASLDYTLIQIWLQNCSSYHKCGKIQSAEREGVDLLLIDVESRKLVPAPTVAKYVALSYVWGQDHATHPSSNPDQRIDGFGKLDSIPQTVEDAITITAALKSKYLWVDAYCINYSDQTNKMTQILNMDWVYENAFLTIAAAAGANSSYGIPGVSRPLLNFHQPQVNTPAGPIMATFCRDISEDFPNWPWSTRAWTFQEGALSERLLIVTDQNYFLRCRSQVYTELLESAELSSHEGPIVGDLFNGLVWSWEWYAEMLPQYTSRQLSFDEDILVAISGLLTRVTKRTKMRFVCGIPFTQSTNLALCWSRNSDSTFLERRPGLPSWAWCGWKGQTTYERALRINPPSDTWRVHVDVLGGQEQGAVIIRIQSTCATFADLVRLEEGKDATGLHSQFIFDIDVEDRSRLHLLYLVHYGPIPGKHLASVVCMIIQQCGRNWRRVGLAVVVADSWEAVEHEICTVTLE